VLAAWAALGGMFIWTYWPTLVHLLYSWINTLDYQHGPFVPVFALFLLWHRRPMIEGKPLQGTWWAVPFFGAWLLSRWLIFYFHYEIDAYSMFPFLIGMTLFLGGWLAMWWAWPSLLFLVFMVPLPGVLATGLSRPLQAIAIRGSVFVLQTLGIPAVIVGGDGNVIQLTDKTLGIEEACSGLRMLMLFFAICLGVAFVLRVRLWERVVLVVSAVPIAVFSNITRIVLVAVMHELSWHHLADFTHNQAAAFVMMPLALLLVAGEMQLIARLLVSPLPEGPLTLGGAPAASRRVSAAGDRLSGGGGILFPPKK
jgi:exosortase